VKLAHYPLTVLLVNDIVHRGVFPDVLKAEPRAEDAQVVKDVGLAEVKEGPELL
jgi:hypothetical protein